MGLFKKAVGVAAIRKLFKKRRGSSWSRAFGRRRHRGGLLRRLGFGSLAFLVARRLFGQQPRHA